MGIYELEENGDLDRKGINPKAMKLIASGIIKEIADAVDNTDYFEYYHVEGTRQLDIYKTVSNLGEKLSLLSENLLADALTE
jgi:hypothetical protein